MRRHSELESLKVGCVRYLNALPLLHGYQGEVIYEHPAVLAHMLERGECDVALVPIMELFLRPGWKVVDGVSIACDGPVYSVFLAYRGELQDVRTVSLDKASLTSVHLLKCLLAEYVGMQPAYGEGDAYLLIGNQAIEFREKHGDAFNYLDLGEEWKRHIGLPFVFALWLIRPEVPRPEMVAEELRRLKSAGLSSLEQVIESAHPKDPEFLRRYFTEHIRYDLNGNEKQAVAKFRELLCKHGLLPPTSFGWEYV